MGPIDWNDLLDFLAMGERSMEKKVTWYWVNTRLAAGGVGVSKGVVVDSAPYFKYLRGRTLEDLSSDQGIREIVLARTGEKAKGG